ncbi:GNAT family N-acetyltransferase [Acanthopleuribacter pedis]|uniref:GNAT family N-acetyltransferase n=1 Tax=Acanthopleuribacter pedis TaxID=442870 RepID=A0A8J7QBI7_9BACT|nr:GNAT family N-acetyltransferase [Acanthopleuribacter pedis]MBO1321069.1 GNAT family N-acetyltransferase [Acanthopleuribacter pedis]
MELTFRAATRDDVPVIVAMLADDALGHQREAYADPLPEFYYTAFAAIQADAHNELMVAEGEGRIVGTLQLTFIPYLTFKGGTRAQVEAVRVHRDFRGRGLGRRFFEWAIERAKGRDCHVVQLTTNKQRDRARDFYDALGFEATHDGMKLYLKPW